MTEILNILRGRTFVRVLVDGTSDRTEAIDAALAAAHETRSSLFDIRARQTRPGRWLVTLFTD